MTIKEDLLRAAAYLEAADDDSASMSGDEADRIAGVLREMAARAVPLVAEAPREPNDSEIERLAGEYIAEDWEPDRYYRNMNVTAFARALLSHLRTAPRPTLSDEHRQMLGEIEQEFVALPDLAAWIRRLQDRLREALASARADALLRELVVSIEEYEKVECIDEGRVRRKRRDAAFAKAQAYARGAPETDRAAMTSTTAKE
jgi:hypothetical protein